MRQFVRAETESILLGGDAGTRIRLAKKKARKKRFDRNAEANLQNSKLLSRNIQSHIKYQKG